MTDKSTETSVGFAENQRDASAAIIQRCFDDREFCRKFKSNPAGTLEGILGSKLPEGVQVQVVESTPNLWSFTVPSSEMLAMVDDSGKTSAIGEADIGVVTGGTTIASPSQRREWEMLARLLAGAFTAESES